MHEYNSIASKKRRNLAIEALEEARKQGYYYTVGFIEGYIEGAKAEARKIFSSLIKEYTKEGMNDKDIFNILINVDSSLTDDEIRELIKQRGNK